MVADVVTRSEVIVAASQQLPSEDWLRLGLDGLPSQIARVPQPARSEFQTLVHELDQQLKRDTPKRVDVRQLLNDSK